MNNYRRIINAQVASMIDGHFHCLDAAAEEINQRTGLSVQKGTLSKRLQGQYGWPIEEVLALEDACGRRNITRLIARRLKADESTASGSMLLSAGTISRETGEAVAAILAAQQSDSSADRAQALAEIQEAIDALVQARSNLEGLEQ